MEGTETLCPHATILNHRWLPGTRSRLLSGKPDEWMHLSPFYTRMHGEWLRYANSTSQYSLAFSLYRDDWGFQVNPLCRHDITSPFPPSGNEGYVRNRDVLDNITLPSTLPSLTPSTLPSCANPIWRRNSQLASCMSWNGLPNHPTSTQLSY